MPEAIVAKTCRTCKISKPLADFYKSPVNRDGYKNRCIICYKAYCAKYSQTKRGKTSARERSRRFHKTEKYKINRQKYRQSEHGKTVERTYNQSKIGKIVKRRSVDKYQKNHPERQKAGAAINNAVQSGALPQIATLQCFCGKQAQDYHHPSYAPENWLVVIPVCRSCHYYIHHPRKIEGCVLKLSAACSS